MQNVIAICSFFGDRDEAPRSHGPGHMAELEFAISSNGPLWLFLWHTYTRRIVEVEVMSIIL
jgi:hypothetical protein